MNKQLRKARQDYRQNIRRVQIESLFRHKRYQFKLIEHQDIKHQVIHHLNIVKNAIISHDQRCALSQSLSTLNKIIDEYSIIHVLCQYVALNPEELPTESKLDINTRYSWLDLLTEIMKEGGTQLMMEECSSIICNAMLQLKVIISSCLQTNSSIVYHDQMKRIMVSYPFEIVKEASTKTIINSLQIAYFISLSKNDSNTLYYLLNKTKPPLLKILNHLYNLKERMNQQVKHQYLKTCLTLTSLVYYFKLQNHQAEYYDKMKQNIIELCLQSLHNSKSKEQFSASSQFIRYIIRLQIYYPKQEEFQDIQSYIQRQTQQQNLKYFQMLHSILYYGRVVLSPKSIRVILLCLFNTKAYKDTKNVQFRIKLLKLLKAQITNNNNTISQQDMNSFQQLWGSNDSACYLVQLASVISSVNQHHLKLFFQVLSYILIRDQNSDELIQTKLYAFMQYPYFRIMLQQIGYCLQGEDEF